MATNNMNKYEFDDHMYEMTKQVLEDKRSFLCKTIQPARHFPYLRQQRVLSLEGQQVIEHEITTAAKVNKFVDELQMNGGPKAFQTFIESLIRDGTQPHVVRTLNRALEEKISKPTVAAAVNQPHIPLDRRLPIEDEDDLVSTTESPLGTPPVEPTDSGPMPGPALPSFDMLKNLKPQGSMPQENKCMEDKLLAHGH